MRILVSLTSIPRRFDSALLAAVAALRAQDLDCELLVNIPRVYRKWGAIDDTAIPALPADVILHRPSQDFGPATKLLGAMEYARDGGFDLIVTVDDDIVLSSPDYLSYLVSFAAACPGWAVTVGGIKLMHPPFRATDGLKYKEKFDFTDAPAGYLGVVYPVAPLLRLDLPFTLAQTLPQGLFNDDDAYFGMVLHQLDVPLLAIPRYPGRRNRAAEGAGNSAVAEGTPLDRVDNESALFSTAHARGLIRTRRMERRLPLARKLRLLGHYVGAAFGTTRRSGA